MLYACSEKEQRKGWITDGTLYETLWQQLDALANSKSSK